MHLEKGLLVNVVQKVPTRTREVVEVSGGANWCNAHRGHGSAYRWRRSRKRNETSGLRRNWGVLRPEVG